MLHWNIQYRISNIILFLILSLFFLPKIIFAQENNIYGIHLAQPHLEDLKKVKELVNSNGGDWGYVTLVIQENDRDKNKWQGIFDLLRQYHLIPIIRLATKPEGDNWKRPKIEDISEWVSFLDSLNWVVKNRYVVLFNEPNHGSEWGGAVDPQDYGKVAFAFAKALKEKNKDFFLMLAGFDASAPQLPPRYWDEEMFLRELFNINLSSFCANFIECINNGLISGWSSHSYPNPGFSGSPYDFGRGTIRNYQWELELLKSLGVNKDLPVFIKETGWQRDIRYSIFDIGKDKIAQNFKIAFEEVWSQDKRIKAVTPFVFDYQAEPFLGFSWKKFNEDDFYPQYYLIQSLPKQKGQPEQDEKGEIKFNLPNELVEQSDYSFKISLKNLGQGYWDDKDYKLKIKNTSESLEFLSGHIGEIAPGEEKEVVIFLKTKSQGKEKISFVLEKNNQEILKSKDWQFNILALPSLKFEVFYWPWGKGEGDDFEIQIFDWEEKLVFKEKGIIVKSGVGNVSNIKNITLSDLYRVVLIKKGYLPRQVYYVFRPKDNLVKFKKLLPFDKNNDGKFDIKDVLAIFDSFTKLGKSL